MLFTTRFNGKTAIIIYRGSNIAIKIAYLEKVDMDIIYDFKRVQKVPYKIEQ